MADRGDEKRSNQEDDMVRGGADEQIRGVANDDDEFEDTEDTDEEEEENEEGSF